MNDRTRFSKAFILTTENAKAWVATFVSDRLRTRHRGIKIRSFIDNNYGLRNDKVIQKALQGVVFSPADLDISALVKLIRNKESPCIIDVHERKTPTLQSNSVGDLVERIVNRRNELVHSGNASLDEQDYNDFLTDMKDIAEKFESINFPGLGTYNKEIDAVHKKILDDTQVKQVIARYELYLDVIIKSELRPDISGSLAERWSQDITEDIDNPVGKLAVGAVVGTIGAAADVATFPFRVLGSIFKK